MTKKTHEEYVAEVAKINSNIEVIGGYVNTMTPISHKCLICGYGTNNEWNPKPNNILNGSGCPVCANNHKAIGPAPEYINSIWSSSYRELAKYYNLTEHQMKTITPMSNKKIKVQCPNCGFIKDISPNTLFKDGFGCNKCSDGISYPEKFMMSLLEQLQINYQYQYSPDWAIGKVYDFYLFDYNCIIETHGIQHYVGWENNKNDLSNQIKNDKLKEDLANQNEVINYITINCRESTVDWIRSNIICSYLPTLLGFSESDIDWNKCNIDALNSKVKNVANLWNMGFSIGQIKQSTKNSGSSINRWLKMAAKIGMCDYNYSQSKKRGRTEEFKKHMMEIQESNSVICVERNMVYLSVRETERKTGINRHCISRCCKGEQRTAGGFQWKYLYDLTQKDGTVIPGAITLGFITEEKALRMLEEQKVKGENINEV